MCAFLAENRVIPLALMMNGGVGMRAFPGVQPFAFTNGATQTAELARDLLREYLA